MVVRRAVAASAVAVGLVGLAAGTASAKSDLTLSVSTHSVHVGQAVKVTAWGDDDAERVTYVCVDQRVGSGHWRQVSCSPRPGRQLTVRVRAAHQGREQFRARLLAPRGGHLVTDRISGPTTVTVR